MSANSQAAIPSWLETPPTGKINPPVETRSQELPFGQLTWENFEKLCLRLAQLEANVEHCQLYGVRGQAQEGIDIYARQRLTEKYRVYQCKRVKDFDVAHIKNAVSKFIEGQWVSQTDTFVLCTQVSLNSTKLADEIETQSKRLKNEDVTFLPWGSDQLSLALKDKPELVDDFFGRAWVAAFCGKEQAHSLGVRQNAEVIVENYREWLSQKTAQLKVPGFPLQRELSIETNWIPLQAKLREGDKTSFDAELIPTLYRLSVVIGAPGTGKSTLLRRLAHCLSAAGKRVIFIRLPDVKQLLDSDKSEGFEWAILKAAADNSGFNDKELRLALSTPDYLLADGLDECKSDRANIADKLDAWVKAHSSTKVVITTRPSDESSLLPGWQHIELSPLNKPDILEYSEQLLAAYCEDVAKVQERLDSLHRQLQDSTNVSLAVKNPLILGFIVQLIAEDVEIGQNRTQLYNNIIKLASKRSPLDRKPLEFRERDAQHIFEIAGWRLLHKPELAADELINSIIEELELIGYTLREAEEKAEVGVEFWQNRCIFERYSLGTQDIISFVHPTLCEYAAGRYASGLSDEKLCQWLERVRRKPEWRESILFCAGSDAAERISNHLLKLDNPEYPTSTEALLAAVVLAEITDAPPKLIEVVVNRILPRLTSPIPDVVFEAAEALLALTDFAPDTIGTIAKSWFNHDQSWTQLAATQLG